MSHIELKRNVWFARLTIPKDVRPIFGKLRFSRTTGTSNEAKADLIADGIVAQWKLLIEQARGASGDQQLIEALRWREQFQLDAAVAGDDTDTHSLLLDRVDEIEAEEGFKKAKEYYGLARGEITPSDVLYEQWKEQLDVVQKTKDQYIKDVELLIKKFNTLEGITRQSVSVWVHGLISEGPNRISKISANRILGSCRNYWSYLQNQFVVPVDQAPLNNLLQSTKAKKSKSKNGWIPFDPTEVVSIWKAAKESEDQLLADLIELSAYTGARIEELCSLKIGDVKPDSFTVVDSKTAAGLRVVPIHSHLGETIARLKQSSTDGYLLSGLSFNKYDDRSNAIGKRFGRLKAKLGFESKKVFHSIRKTFVTQLENAGVPEGVVADIVGHEKQTMTYGLYSGGARLDVKQKAIEHVVYYWST